MKKLIQITAVLFLSVQTYGFCQTNSTAPSYKTQDTLLTKQNDKTNITKSFIGTYIMEEADFTLEIVEENGLMYIITKFSKDLLVQKDETTLNEPTRGVDLQLIQNNKEDIKFSQNGYETVLKRVKSDIKE